MKGLILLIIAYLPQVLFAQDQVVSRFSIDEKPNVRIDDHMQGVWKMREDTDKHNYFIVEKDGDYEYCMTYMNRSGDNRGLEHGGGFFSMINNVKFLTMPSGNNDGWLILKIKDVTRGSWDVTLNLITDPRLRSVKSRAELRELIEKNLNNPAFYSKDLHLRKKFEFNSCHG